MSTLVGTGGLLSLRERFRYNFLLQMKMRNTYICTNYVIYYAIFERGEEEEEGRDKSLNTKYYSTIGGRQIMPRAQ